MLNSFQNADLTFLTVDLEVTVYVISCHVVPIFYTSDANLDV